MNRSLLYRKKRKSFLLNPIKLIGLLLLGCWIGISSSFAKENPSKKGDSKKVVSLNEEAFYANWEGWGGLQSLHLVYFPKSPVLQVHFLNLSFEGLYFFTPTLGIGGSYQLGLASQYFKNVLALREIKSLHHSLAGELEWLFFNSSFYSTYLFSGLSLNVVQILSGNSPFPIASHTFHSGLLVGIGHKFQVVKDVWVDLRLHFNLAFHQIHPLVSNPTKYPLEILFGAHFGYRAPR